MLRYGLILLALTMSAGAMHAQKVKVDWDRDTDFVLYKTYKWTKIPTPRTPTDAIEKLIQELTDVQMDAKGLKKIKEGEPDLYVGYRVTLSQPKQEASASAPPTTEGAWQTGRSWSAQTGADQAERQGTLSIDIADRKKERLIWRGTVIADVGDSVNDARAKISRGLSKAFAKFPPPPK